jgi:NADP-dependent 3-hydroxy acid dehydrogenase YdfG
MRWPIRGLRDSRDHFSKNILITGAAHGIGRALATHYAHDGISLALFDKDRENLQTVFDECTKLGAAAAMFVVDVTNRTEMDQNIFYYMENCGTPTLVIANAGISIRDDSDCYESAKEIMETNFFGVLNTFDPILIRTFKPTHLVVISSISSLMSTHNSGGYSASKSAVVLYLDAMRLRYNSAHVKISNLVLGFVSTTMTSDMPHAKHISISIEKAISLIDVAIRSGRPSISIPRIRNSVWYGLRILPLPIRNRLLVFARKQIYKQ